MPENSVCAEIGSWKGNFAQKILDFTNPRKLYLIDPYTYVADYERALYGGKSGSQAKVEEVYQSVIKRFSSQINSGQLVLLRKNSEEGLKTFENNSLDWVYIDGNHTYEFVKRDLEISFEKVRAGGFITGDDYASHGWWEDGVTKAVNEFVKERKGTVKKIVFKRAQFILKKK